MEIYGTKKRHQTKNEATKKAEANGTKKERAGNWDRKDPTELILQTCSRQYGTLFTGSARTILSHTRNSRNVYIDNSLAFIQEVTGLGRGQLSGFVVLGIVILFAAIGLLYVQELSRLKPLEVKLSQVGEAPEEARLLHDQVTNCVTALSEDYIMMLGMSGGLLLIKIDPEHLEFPIRDWLKNGNAASPTPEELQTDMARVLESTADYCVTTYSIPGLQELKAKDAPTAKVLFTEKDVVVKLAFPLRATFADQTYDLNEFAVTIPVRMKHVLGIAKQITDRNQAAPEILGEEQLAEFDVNTKVKYVSSTYRLYSITDKLSSLRKRPYTFVFGEEFT